MQTTSKPSNRTARAGFTLVELAIVLVIIGLIIGGVLVGQDMIKAAEVRATAGQIEKYNATVNTFRDKYQFIPGDLTKTAAARFGFPPIAPGTPRTGAVGHGDGNGLLEGCSATAATGIPVAGCETIMFWLDLNSANLIDGSFTTATDGFVTAADPDAVKALLPGAKLGRGNMVSVYGFRGLNYYQLGGVTAISAAGVPTVTNTLTPQEAFNIDAKIDDGKPGTGVARAAGAGTYNITVDNAGTILPACASSSEYNAIAGVGTASTDAANTPACNIRIRFN